MKTVSTALTNYLAAGGTFLVSDLFDVTLADGRVYHWTTAPRDVTCWTVTYTTSPRAKRGPIRMAATLEADVMELTIQAGPSILVSDTRTIIAAAVDGVFDGASVVCRRIIWGPTGIGDTSLGTGFADGTILRFSGRVDGTEPRETGVLLSVLSDLEDLGMPLPGQIYQPSCTWQLYSPGCGVTKATHTTTGTASAGSTGLVINGTGIVAAHKLGWLTFTAGANLNVRRMVAAATTGAATVNVPFPFTPSVGDAWSIVKGCDKTKTMCDGTFSNLARHRGFPNMPIEEATT